MARQRLAIYKMSNSFQSRKLSSLCWNYRLFTKSSEHISAQQYHWYTIEETRATSCRNTVVTFTIKDISMKHLVAHTVPTCDSSKDTAGVVFYELEKVSISWLEMRATTMISTLCTHMGIKANEIKIRKKKIVNQIWSQLKKGISFPCVLAQQSKTMSACQLMCYTTTPTLHYNSCRKSGSQRETCKQMITSPMASSYFHSRLIEKHIKVSRKTKKNRKPQKWQGLEGKLLARTLWTKR